MTLKNFKLGVLALCSTLFVFESSAQSIPSSELYHQLLRVKETKRVLYVAAHPDDENTRLIAYLSNAIHAEVGYLSLTRGDGGQNLIGPQLGVELGQIRTQELLKARETDGGRQFFTRATDFGYSKDPDETLKNWTKNEILSDVVWVIRNFRPDLIITRFNTIPGVTHGHHTTSAILAGEAFDLAADPNAFPEQLDYVETWQPKRIFWNSYNFGGRFEEDPKEQYDVFPVGDFNPLLGETYSQIAADSRTMHKSQGFGATATIGGATDHIQFLKGEAFDESSFEGIPNRWEQVDGGVAVEMLLTLAIDSFDFKNPSHTISLLLQAKAKLAAIDADVVWLQEKKDNLDRLIIQMLGVDMELNASEELVSPGDEVEVELILNNPSSLALENSSLTIFGSPISLNRTQTASNQVIESRFKISLPEDYPYSQPYWLANPIDGAMYDVRDQQLIGKAFNDPNLTGELAFTVDDQRFIFSVPLMYKYNDRVDGEIQQPLTIVPQINLTVSTENVFLLANKNPEIRVTVDFQNQMMNGELQFEGLGSDDFKILTVTDLPTQRQRVYSVAFLSDRLQGQSIVAQYKTSSGTVFDQTMERISFSHIPNLTYFHPAQVNLIKADWKISGDKIGYIPGAGDDVPGVLEALGYSVTMLGEGDFSVENFSQYKAIVVGIRAYNTNRLLAENQQALMGYVLSGGTVIVQYNTSSGLLTNQLGPYDFALSRTRVTVQESPVDADYDHPLLAFPNQIVPDDFEGWVQERGLYFVTDLAKEYQTPLIMNEPGEEPTNGSLIYAKYGEGTFIYTGISFFRQLPAGVSGATKLFVNMIEQ
ncbi:PIG-L family deacetylase [Algoriphagus namhaensis]